ncbi:hypothetical protein BN961_02790 [Afipia felis]|uniref:Uncharacterized protein n=1 Tax=Afipia felis TaxID=1035 RepID=A0A090MPT6_AFIFE|nr:hypothetical protein BN961_02790 [Afipia felis]
MQREEVACQVDVFGGDPHAAVVLDAERGRDVVEVGHGADIDPRLRHGDHHVGAAEAERLDQHHALVGVGDAFADQILAGNAEVDLSACKLGCDFARGEIGDLDLIEARDGATIVARAARLGERKTCASEERVGIFLKPALGGDGENERVAHAASPALVSASIQTENPTAGMGEAAPNRVSRPS